MKKVGLAIMIVLVVGALVALKFLPQKYLSIAPFGTDSLSQKSNTAEPSPAVSSTPISLRDPNFSAELPEGFRISVFADNLSQVRVLKFSPRGTLLASVLDQGKIVALPDKDGNGQADEVVEILTGLNRPHGLAFASVAGEAKFFVAEETKVVRYNWNEESLSALPDKVLFSLPTGGRHFTRSLAIDKNGRLFVSIGSTCDVCQEKDERLAAILVSNVEGENSRVFARGLRNSVFITIDPSSGELWGTEMGRDFLGDNLPPDEVNIIKENSDYGWPVCYGRNVHDSQFDKKPFMEQVVGTLEQVRCGSKKPPVYEIAAHSAPLGLAFINSPLFPVDWQGDLLVSYHGSWNRSTPIGYKVVRLKVDGEGISGEEDFLTGFLRGSQVLGRPVDLVFDSQGVLFISDDKSGSIYRIDRSE